VPIAFELVHEVSLWAEGVGKVWSKPDEAINLWVVREWIAKEDGSEIVEDLVPEGDFHFVLDLITNKIGVLQSFRSLFLVFDLV
jgi:hypothetical protein